MYGDTGAMRTRAAQLRDQGMDIRSMADRIVAETEGVAWTGRAADAMRERIRERAGQLRKVAGRHDTAAEALERHLHEVDRRKDTIADAERRAAREDGADPEPPPPGHRDWLTHHEKGR